MQRRLSSGDRKILVIAGIAFIALLVMGFLLAPSSADAKLATTYSTASEGARAAYLLLAESGYRVERWQRPASDLKPEEHTVLIIADPVVVPDASERKAVGRFIAAGGRVIANGIVGAGFLPEDASSINLLREKPWTEFPALMPSPLTRAAPRITLAPVAAWGNRYGIPLYGKGDDIVAARLVHGQGDAIWLAAATPLTNAGLKQSGNLEFLLAAIGDRDRTRVLFDEYVHGFDERESREKTHPLTMALVLQSAVLAAAALFTFSRRSGPLRPMPAESRLAPLEFVETLGALYENANATSVAVDVCFQRFQFWITRRLALPKDASPEEVARGVRDRWQFDDPKFLETLRAAASARYDPGLPQGKALRIVEALHSYAVKLQLFSVAKGKN
jgi:hypothetical protein